MTTPEPPVPPECDCRGLPYMPLDVVRLRDSDLAALATGEEFKAAVLLWCAAWGQVPAGSLPDDERILARLAGVTLADWQTVKDMALRGWELCSDGRLYHEVIAEKALEAWAGRTRQRARAEARWSKRPDPPDDAPALPPHSRGTGKGMPRHAKSDAAAMQGKGIVKDSPIAPQGGLKDPTSKVAKADVDAIWSAAPKRSRERSSRSDVERSLASAVKRGKRIEDVASGLAAYFASDAATKDGGEYVKGVHRMIEGDRWESFVEPAGASKSSLFDRSSADEEDPWRRRVREYSRNAYWNRLDWGPEPGRTGCQAPPMIQREFGVEPAAPQPVGGHAA